MKLVLKQKLLSVLSSYNVMDENDNIKYVVKGKLGWKLKLHIFDESGKQLLAKITQPLISILPTYNFFIDNQKIGKLKKRISFLKTRFKLDYKKWKVEGNYLAWNYKVLEGDSLIMSCNKKVLNLTDVYEMDITEENDALICLMIALSFDLGRKRKK